MRAGKRLVDERCVSGGKRVGRRLVFAAGFGVDWKCPVEYVWSETASPNATTCLQPIPGNAEMALPQFKSWRVLSEGNDRRQLIFARGRGCTGQPVCRLHSPGSSPGVPSSISGFRTAVPKVETGLLFQEHQSLCDGGSRATPLRPGLWAR